jgi:hypothetical protein
MDFTTILLLAVGGYFLFSKIGSGTPVAPAGTTNTTNANQDTVSQQQQVNQVAANHTINAIIADMTSNGEDPSKYYSTDKWGFYYRRTRGIDAPTQDVLFPGDPANKMYSLPEWWGAMTGHGFSGIGTIARHVNPYINPVVGLHYGSNLRANASEKSVVKFTN